MNPIDNSSSIPLYQPSQEADNQTFVNEIDNIQLALYDGDQAGALSKLAALVNQMEALPNKTPQQKDALAFLKDALSKMKSGAPNSYIISELGAAKGFLW